MLDIISTTDFCEVTLTVNGKSKTFVPKAICNGKVSDGIYVRPRIG